MYDPGCPLPDSFRRTALAGAVISLGFALTALLGWALGRLSIPRLATGGLPMAPSTALVVGLIGVGLLARVVQPRGPIGRHGAAAAAILAGSASGLLLARKVLGYDLTLEHLLFQTPHAEESIPIGHMSPITASVALAAAVALLSRVAGPAALRARTSVAGALAAAVLGVAFVMLLGYLYGTPLLYGSSVIPVALPTAFALFLVGAALLAEAGPSAWPTRMLAGSSISASLLRVLLPALLVLLVVEGLVDSLVLPRYRANPALAVAIKALLSIGVFSVVVTVIARRISAPIDEARALVRASEARYRAVTETAGDAIVSADGRGAIALWNPAAEAIFGYTAAEAIGRPLALLMPERFRQAHAEGFERAVATGSSKLAGTTVELVGRRKSGEEFALELSLATARDGTFTAILRDVTARRAAEAERERLIADLQRALADVKTLSGIIPICAACKRIRDDAGYWHAVEAYVRDHTDAQFSHGVCPSCAARLYPEFTDRQET